jgi:acetyl-CoA carboxylase biotin carboxylase subunit
VWGADRAEALARARRALGEFGIEGVRTTRELFLDVVNEPRFMSGHYTTAYLEDARAALPSLGTEMAA